MKSILVLTVMLTSISSAYEFDKISEYDLPSPAVKIVRDKNNDFKDVVVRVWSDQIETESGKKYYTYQQGYSYAKKQGYLRTLDKDGSVVHEAYSIKNDGGVSREEVLLAFELFKAHPDIQKQLSGVKERLYIYGGFNYLDQDEKAPCYWGNRCLHVFVSTKSDPVLAHAIVRLTDKTIPYPRFDTEMTLKQLVVEKSKRHFKK